MNRLVKGIVAVAAVVAVTPALAHAGDDTTTTVYEVPEQCWIEEDTGPARVVHGRAATEEVDLPYCDEIEGICVEVVWPGDDGPARVAHRPAEEAEITGAPCVPIDPACEFTYYVEPPAGPSRSAHQSARPFGGVDDVLVVDIPEECQEALSQAFGPTGRESGTIAWIAALLVGLGGVLLVTRRAIAIRTR